MTAKRYRFQKKRYVLAFNIEFGLFDYSPYELMNIAEELSQKTGKTYYILQEPDVEGAPLNVEAIVAPEVRL